MDEFKEAKSGTKITTSTLLLVVVGIAIGAVVLGGLSFLYFSREKEEQEETSPQLTPAKSFGELQSTDVIAKVGEENLYFSDIEAYAGFRETDVNAIEDKQQAVDDLIRVSVILQAAAEKGWIELSEEYFNSPTKEITIRGDKIREIYEIFESIGRKGTVIETVAVWFWNQELGQLGKDQGVEAAKSFAKTKIDYVHRLATKEGKSMKEAGEVLAADSSLEQLDVNYKYNAYLKDVYPYEITSVEDVRRGQEISFDGMYDFIKGAEIGDISEVYLEEDKLPLEGVIDAYYAFYRFDSKNEDYDTMDDLVESYKQKLGVEIYIEL